MVNLILGLDTGNGYVKGRADVLGHGVFNIDMPSTVAYISSDVLPHTASDEYMDDIFNKLDININSKSINEIDNGRILLGTRGIYAGASQREFNIDDRTPKCMDALSMQLILGTTAGSALKAYWAKHKALPKIMSVNAIASLGLPIEDYLQYKDMYAKMLKDVKHYVHIHNFEEDITVDISFEEVVVLPEGAAGQYAITRLGADFLQMSLDIARESGIAIDSEYTGEMLAGAQNTIGVDIGEGTVNFPVFTQGSVNIEASSSINKGYGTVLSAAENDLRNSKHPFGSRKDLADFMLQEALMPAKRKIKSEAQMVLNKHIPVFVRDVMKEYTNVFKRVGARTDVIYVYGGGATSVKDVLYPALVDASKVDDDYVLPIIYMDSVYSRDLNRTGLFITAKAVAKELGWIVD